MLSWLTEQGGYSKYCSDYAGSYFGLDGKLHVIWLESGSAAQQKALQSYLKAFESSVVYECGGYPETEVRAYADDLALALKELGLIVASWGYDPETGHASLNVLAEDLPHVLSLMEAKNPYPFGNTKYLVVFGITIATEY